MPKKRPEYRNNRPHSDFLTSLSSMISSPEVFESHILYNLRSIYDIEELTIEHVNHIVSKILDDYHGDWNKIVRTKYVEFEENINNSS